MEFKKTKKKQCNTNQMMAQSTWNTMCIAVMLTACATLLFNPQLRTPIAEHVVSSCVNVCPQTFTLTLETDAYCAFISHKVDSDDGPLVMMVPGTGHTACDYVWIFESLNATVIWATPKTDYVCAHMNIVCDVDLLRVESDVRVHFRSFLRLTNITYLVSHSVGVQTTLKALTGVQNMPHVRLIAFTPWGIHVHMMQLLFVPFVFVVSNADCVSSLDEVAQLVRIAPAPSSVFLFWNSSHAQWAQPVRHPSGYTNPTWCRNLLPEVYQHALAKQLVHDLVRTSVESEYYNDAWYSGSDWLQVARSHPRPCDCCDPDTWRTGVHGNDILCRNGVSFP